MYNLPVITKQESMYSTKFFVFTVYKRIPYWKLFLSFRRCEMIVRNTSCHSLPIFPLSLSLMPDSVWSRRRLSFYFQLFQGWRQVWYKKNSHYYIYILKPMITGFTSFYIKLQNSNSYQPLLKAFDSSQHIHVTCWILFNDVLDVIRSQSLLKFSSGNKVSYFSQGPNSCFVSFS